MIFRGKFIPINMKRKVMFFVDYNMGNANTTVQNNINNYINSANDMSVSPKYSRQTLLTMLYYGYIKKRPNYYIGGKGR